MRLIAEEINNVDFLCEENEGKKNYFIEGIFLQAELKNRNNRMYPLKTLSKEVAKYCMQIGLENCELLKD